MTSDQQAHPHAMPKGGQKTRSIAFLSGKGGSGKTMIAAVAAAIFGKISPTVLMDADTGTGGLTYYLGVKHIENFTLGWLDREPGAFPLQQVRGFHSVQFLGIGDHRKLIRNRQSLDIPGAIQQTIRALDGGPQWVLVDCRGGIDDDSLATCAAVDDIILVVEADTTSFQATQNVVDALSEAGLAGKLRGFILNKMIDDPSTLARSATSVFRTQYLGAIPFDIDAVRDFIVGDIPESTSILGIHLTNALHRAYPQEVPPPVKAVWTPSEFRSAGLRDPRSTRGGLIAAAGILVSGAVLAAALRVGPGVLPLSGNQFVLLVFGALTLGLFGSLDSTRRIMGDAFQAYFDVFRRIALLMFRVRRR